MRKIYGIALVVIGIIILFAKDMLKNEMLVFPIIACFIPMVLILVRIHVASEEKKYFVELGFYFLPHIACACIFSALLLARLTKLDDGSMVEPLPRLLKTVAFYLVISGLIWMWICNRLLYLAKKEELLEEKRRLM